MAPRLSDEDRFPFPECREYAVYMATYRTGARNTLSRHMSTMSMFGRAMIAEHGLKKMAEITIPQVLGFMNFYTSTRASGSADKLREVLLSFFDWMCKEGRMPAGWGPLQIPPILTNKGCTTGILLPETIFKMRRVIGCRLRNAMAIEILLSSGIRWDELCHVRPCDIRFDDGPIDINTNQRSLYVGGVIVLKRESKTLKGNKSRVTYISTLARRLILQYMDRMGLEPTSKVPLYPYDRSLFYKDIEGMQQEMPELKGTEYQLRKMGTPDTVEDYGLTGQEHPELIRNLQSHIKRNNTFFGPVDPSQNRDIIERERGLHPHKLRHSFTCFQYYMCYSGERHDKIRVSGMLGHSNLVTTDIYLTHVDAIKSLDEWRRLWTGRTGDWSRLE